MFSVYFSFSLTRRCCRNYFARVSKAKQKPSQPLKSWNSSLVVAYTFYFCVFFWKKKFFNFLFHSLSHSSVDVNCACAAVQRYKYHEGYFITLSLMCIARARKHFFSMWESSINVFLNECVVERRATRLRNMKQSENFPHRKFMLRFHVDSTRVNLMWCRLSTSVMCGGS